MKSLLAILLTACFLLFVVTQSAEGRSSLFNWRGDDEGVADTIKRKGTKLKDDIADTASNLQSKGAELRDSTSRKGQRYAANVKDKLKGKPDIAKSLEGTAESIKAQGKQFVNKAQRGKEQYVDQPAANLKKKGKRFADDAADTLERKRKEYFEDHEDDSWHIPVISTIADKFRGKSADDIDDATDSYAKKGKKFAGDAADKLKEKKKEYSGDFDDKVNQLKKKGKEYSDKAAEKLKEKRQQYIDDEDDEDDSWHIPVISTIADKFRGKSADDIDDATDSYAKKGKKFAGDAADKLKEKKKEYSGDFDDKVNQLKKKGKEYSDKAAEKLKEKRQQYIDDEDDEDDSWHIPVISTIADKFRGKPADDYRNDAKEAAETYTAKGKKLAGDAADKLKQKKKEYSGDFDQAKGKLKKKGKQFMSDVEESSDNLKRKGSKLSKEASAKLKKWVE